MYILKNAWKNIVRNKSRNILIGIVLLFIGIASTITLAVYNTSTSLIKSYEDSYEVEATIGFDRESMKNDFDFTNKDGMTGMKDRFNAMESISKEEVINYADSEYVKNVYYTYSINVNSSTIEKVSSDFSFEGRGDRPNKPNMGGNFETYDFVLNSYNSIDYMNEFINGNYTINESVDNIWELLFDGDYTIINEELASLNEIELNDKITFTYGDTTKELTVIGIYSEKTNDDMNNMNMFSNSANTIITNVDVIDYFVNENENLNGNVNAKFILNSFDEVDKFEEELYEKGLNEYYVVTTNEDNLKEATSSVSNVKSFVLTFLIMTFIIGAVVLIVINLINIRERKYEIGVLRTIGMKKSSLTLQFTLELLIVTFISLIIGCGIGTLLSKPVGNKLLSNEIQNSEESRKEIDNNFGRGDRNPGMNMPDIKVNGMVNVEKIDSIDAIVDFKVVLELFVIGLLLTIISSITSMISIQRFSPLTILKERS